MKSMKDVHLNVDAVASLVCKWSEMKWIETEMMWRVEMKWAVNEVAKLVISWKMIAKRKGSDTLVNHIGFDRSGPGTPKNPIFPKNPKNVKKSSKNPDAHPLGGVFDPPPGGGPGGSKITLVLTRFQKFQKTGLFPGRSSKTAYSEYFI